MRAIDLITEAWLKDMLETILEHEEQGCSPQEVASLVNLEIAEVQEVKEWMGCDT